ncbi:hypothetical protein FHU10_0826 [Serratia fonticola]|uniref:Uncharacterized protein n=1 Tax=Serratia fonticola TaxID=47917 RepID=A0A559T1A5_SERFO|nr:hypothetical protein FHU09_1621 [Serratia fonticola]TQI98868.1 hypothetical protein FHU11_4427 [Serratia fonticola]TVZ68394.1 hypothetical protein FHU10_0826 [Serratia fonticola]
MTDIAKWLRFFHQSLNRHINGSGIGLKTGNTENLGGGVGIRFRKQHAFTHADPARNRLTEEIRTINSVNVFHLHASS